MSSPLFLPLKDRKLEAIEIEIANLATDLVMREIVLFRINAKDMTLFPADWKKLSKIEQDKWLTNTKKRIADEIKTVNLKVSFWEKYAKTL